MGPANVGSTSGRSFGGVIGVVGGSARVSTPKRGFATLLKLPTIKVVSLKAALSTVEDLPDVIYYTAESWAGSSHPPMKHQLEAS